MLIIAGHARAIGAVRAIATDKIVPTIFAHAAVAAVCARLYRREPRVPARYWATAIACAIAPDLDTVLGIPGVELWDDLFAHRGFTHSLLFAVLLAGAVVALGFRDLRRRERWGAFVFFFVVTASHGVLDALTNGGPGVAFFAPFSRETYFFPWRPLEVSPLRAAFFSARGWQALQSELLWIGVPLALTLAAYARGRRKN